MGGFGWQRCADGRNGQKRALVGAHGQGEQASVFWALVAGWIAAVRLRFAQSGDSACCCGAPVLRGCYA